MAVTEDQRKENMKIMSIYISIILTAIFMYLLGYIFYLTHSYEVTFLESIALFGTKLSEFHIFYPINTYSLLGMFFGLILGGISYFLLQLDNVRNYAYKEDEVAGTGGYLDKKEMQEYAAKNIFPDPPVIKDNLPVSFNIEKDTEKYSKNMIMSMNFSRPIDSKLIGNNNVLVVGGSGSGKSRFFGKPNILQMNASYIITDPKGEMLNDTGKVLKDHGYKIKVFNISEMGHSNCYNPLNYIRDEAGVNMVIECLINNTTKGGGGGDNQFFVDAEKLLYSACIFYLIDFCHDESKKNFANILNMINSSAVNEQDPNAKSPLDLLFEKCPYNSLARKYYRSFKQAAGKTLKSIIISCVTRLQPFMTPQVVNLTKIDDMELGSIGEEKTAVFIITPAADRTYSFLASMLYSQLFETLYYHGEQRKAQYGSEKMPIPIRCIMDEFANIGEIPEFPQKLSTMRSYNISACVILQDIAQIEKMYKDDYKTIIGNCSTLVFLGSPEQNTLQYFSDKLGKKTIRTRSRGVSKGGKGGSNKNFQNTGREVETAEELGKMPPDTCIVFTQNMRPVKDKKYVYELHPYFDQTADYDKELSFRYKEMSVFDNTKQDHVESIIKAQAEAKRYKEMKDKENGVDMETVNPDKQIVNGNMDEEVNKYGIADESIENQAYSHCLQKCQLEAAQYYNDKACIFKIDNVPSKYLYKLVEQVSDSLQKNAMLIFTDVTINKKDNFMVGIGIDKDDIGLKDAMNNEFSQGLNEENGYLLTVINKHMIDDYRKNILENL